MEKKGSERACQPNLSLLYLGLALLTGVVLVEVCFIHHLYQEVSLIKAELAVRAVGTSDSPDGNVALKISTFSPLLSLVQANIILY